MPSDIKKAAKVVPVPTLRFDSGPLVGGGLRLDRDVATVGRRPGNAYVIPEPGVSRVHAEVRKVGSSVIVTDLGSSSGTKVNGEPLEGPTVLRHGDRVAFGHVTCVFEDPATAVDADEVTMVLTMPVVPTGPRLSPRQQQVIELVAAGMTNLEIGEQLGITERTVKAYAQELYDKLGVRNRAGAVAEAWNLGLLTDTFEQQRAATP